MTRIAVLDAETLDLPAEDWQQLHPIGKVTLHDYTPYDEAEIIQRCKGADIVLSNKVPLRSSILERLPDLGMIGVLATGMNNVDLECARARGIHVANVPDYSTPAVVQHTFALLLALTNRPENYNHAVHEGRWCRSRQFTFWDHQMDELAGKTFGIVGYGTIGKAVASVAHAFGMRVIVHTRTPRDAPPWQGFAFVSAAELFSSADVISLHCPQTPENTGFVNSGLLGRMRQGSILINTARGGLIHESDLREALLSGPLAAAALDVIDGEPMRERHPLLGLSNCLITPHIGWATVAARKRLLAATCANINAFLSRQS
jgi:glycerate dehydrogenase